MLYVRNFKDKKASLQEYQRSHRASSIARCQDSRPPWQATTASQSAWPTPATLPHTRCESSLLRHEDAKGLQARSNWRILYLQKKKNTKYHPCTPWTFKAGVCLQSTPTFHQLCNILPDPGIKPYAPTVAFATTTPTRQYKKNIFDYENNKTKVGMISKL